LYDPADGHTRHAHIVYYERTRGPVPSGLQLDHTCRCRACVNPSHLEQVTSATNVRRGLLAKLTVKSAQAIRQEYAAGGVTQAALARRYGVHPQTVFHVVHGNTWRPQPELTTEGDTR
jgi:DNA-binding XRE family transcriptional regulator